MECIYIPEINQNETNYKISDNEAHHLKVLRLQSGNQVLITSGKGQMAIATINRTSKNNFEANIIKWFNNNMGEVNFKIGLAIGILDNRERFEFAIEKSTELGISAIYPLITEHSQQNKINKDRLITKTINTIKQCKRSILPTINHPTTITELLENEKSFDRIIVADENGTNVTKKLENDINTLLFIGSEGGFSDDELNIFRKKVPRKKVPDNVVIDNVVMWNLGNRRLRSETAAITGVSLLSLGF
jgi:16S rRNA (uracil1498-N3)-methyltransferase